MIRLFIVISKFLNYLYGYEAVNLIFRVTPSRATISILKHFGADIGDSVTLQNPIVIHGAESEPIYKNLRIGDNTYVGRNCFFDLTNTISISQRVSISHGVVINTHTNAGKSELGKRILQNSSNGVYINKDAFIGINSVLLQGVNIGKRSVIGAFSLVMNDIEDDVIASGNPCSIIKRN